MQTTGRKIETDRMRVVALLAPAVLIISIAVISWAACFVVVQQFVQTTESSLRFVGEN